MRRKAYKKNYETSLCWNVWYYNFNAKRIEAYNVFHHGGFLDDCRKAAAEHGEDRAAFEEEVHHSLMYYYWCKCEWEVIISGWPTTKHMDEAKKVDVYSQINMNWGLFADYMWNHREELKNGQ